MSVHLEVKRHLLGFEDELYLTADSLARQIFMCGEGKMGRGTNGGSPECLPIRGAKFNV